MKNEVQVTGGQVSRSADPAARRFEELCDAPSVVSKAAQVRRGRDQNITLLAKMNEIVDRALAISGLDAEYDAVCRQVTNTFGPR